jgi:HEAT repeat protein
MFYAAQRGAEPVLSAVIVYPRGEGNRVVFSAKQKVESAEQLAHALDSPDEVQRRQAVQSLIEHLGIQSRELVLRALDDPSDHVREQALYSALEAAFPLPVDTLIRLATTDVATSVRLNAMEALADNLQGTDAPQRLSAIADVAASDQEAYVREKAAKLLEQLTNQLTSPESSPAQE